jgi:hypothetical protein
MSCPQGAPLRGGELDPSSIYLLPIYNTPTIAILNEKQRSFFFSLRSLRLCGLKNISAKVLSGLGMS